AHRPRAGDVGADIVALDHVAGGAQRVGDRLDGDPFQAARDDVAGSGRGAADEVVLPRNLDADLRVAEGGGAACVQADDVALDGAAAGEVREGDAAAVVGPRAVAGNDVARPGARGRGQAADEDARGLNIDTDTRVRFGQLPHAVGADVVALDDQA